MERERTLQTSVWPEQGNVVPGNAAAYFLKVPPVIPFDWAAIGLGICSLVGIIFGTYPAYKAANLDPIESLRYE